MITQMVKNLPAVLETQVQSLDWEDPMEKGMATSLPVSLPGEFHGQGLQRVGQYWVTNTFTSTRKYIDGTDTLAGL